MDINEERGYKDGCFDAKTLTKKEARYLAQAALWHWNYGDPNNPDYYALGYAKGVAETLHDKIKICD